MEELNNNFIAGNNEDQVEQVTHISPNQTLTTEPYVTIRIMGMKNAYVPSANSNYDLYLNLGLDLTLKHKTQSIKNTPNPKWKEYFTLPLEEFKNANFFNVSVYDKDDFGSDEFMANQILPTSYFVRQFSKKQQNIFFSFTVDQDFNYDLQILEDEQQTLEIIQNKLSNKAYMKEIQYIAEQEKINLKKTQQQGGDSKNNSNYEKKKSKKSNSAKNSFKSSKSDVKSSNNLDQQPQKQQELEEQKINENENDEKISNQISNDLNLENKSEQQQLTQQKSVPPYITIEIVIMDIKQLYKLSCEVISIQEHVQETQGMFGHSKETVVFYELFVKRNDGLCWRLQRRYKQIRKFRDECSEKLDSVKQIDFPSKDVFLQLKQMVSMTSEEELKIQCEKRKEELQKFFNSILQIDAIYSLESFEEFFSYN